MEPRALSLRGGKGLRAEAEMGKLARITAAMAAACEQL
jgi:hypothetical protein